MINFEAPPSTLDCLMQPVGASMRLVMARRCVLVPVPWFAFDVFLRFLYFGLFEVFFSGYIYILPRRLSRSVPDKVFSLCGVEPSSRRERQTGSCDAHALL